MFVWAIINDVVFCLTLKQLGRTRLLHNSNRTHTGVVSEVSPGQIVVDWIHQRDVYDADGTRVTSPPPETIGVDGLWALTFFAHTCWQLVSLLSELTFCNTHGQLY